MKKNAYMVYNPLTPNQGPIVAPDLCIACYTCVDVCRADVLMPNLEEDQPPVALYPDECWFCGCCVSDCPEGALKIMHPLNQRIGWKRKKTGEYFRIGMTNPPPANTIPPVGMK